MSVIEVFDIVSRRVYYIQNNGINCYSNHIYVVGRPYTLCRTSTSKYLYNEYNCLYDLLRLRMMAACGCLPNYVDLLIELDLKLHGNASVRSCTFTDHAQCVSKIIRNFAWRDRRVIRF